MIDEQHKFDRQRSELANKGGDHCDVLLMSLPYSKNNDDVFMGIWIFQN